MAEHAIGVNCGQCGTLTAVGGKLSDPEFSAQCGTCGAGVTSANPKYIAPADGGKHEIAIEIPQADGTTGSIEISGYDVEVVMKNVQTGPGVPQQPPEGGEGKPDDNSGGEQPPEGGEGAVSP